MALIGVGKGEQNCSAKKQKMGGNNWNYDDYDFNSNVLHHNWSIVQFLLGPFSMVVHTP